MRLLDWVQRLPEWILIPVSLLLCAAAARSGMRIAKGRTARALMALTITWGLAGLIMNRAAMWSNGGKMPVYDPEHHPLYVPVGPNAPRHVEVGNDPGQLPRPSVRLLLLCDIIPIELRGTRYVVSAGDLLVLAGLPCMTIAFALTLCRRRRSS